MKHSCNLLPYPVFISRLADRYQMPVFAGDVFYEAATTGLASRVAATTSSLHSPLYLRSVFIGAFSARGYEALGYAGEIDASSESPDREHPAYDLPSIPGCRFFRARAHIF
ncbi:hypothetical protein PIB30_076512 [Stylosanthes scabra]|uniref:Uncharacterized protein n=1 Tax=Stylosanthes scabra TaxID=79078 RepID=A0ABU6SS68_9FABA|nr:hypothetical protein [Stylosanthes scabra]